MIDSLVPPLVVVPLFGSLVGIASGQESYCLDQQGKARQDHSQLFEHGEGVLHSLAGAPQPLGVLQLQLIPGRDYALLCFIADSAKAPPHFMLGMLGTIHVTEH